MNSELNRLRTFDTWPSDARVPPVKLARAGFYYTEQEQTVKCFSCHLELSEWNYGEQVMAKHKHLSPHCQYVINPTNSGNIPNIPDVPTTQQNASSLNLKEESDRLKTFTNWPKPDIVSPVALAKSGFYWLHLKDYTKCAYCDVVLVSWDPGDVPDDEHRRCAPNCQFVQEVLNSKLGPRAKSMEFNLQLIASDNLKELGVQQHRLPKHPDYATYETRLQTYANWPRHVIQSPEVLASAGFYYEGVGDRVRCFHCDGGLNHWNPKDEPWSQHAYWFSSCTFIQLTKGPEFVEECGKSLTPEDASTSAPKRNVVWSDQTLRPYLESEQAKTALEIGIQVERVKQALKRKLQRTGVGFDTADDLIESALNLQLNDEDVDSDDGNSRLATTVSNILADVIFKSAVADHSANIESTAELKVENRPEEVGDADGAITLEEENRLLKEARMCKICMDAEVGIVLLPCGHLSTCVQCAPNLKDCPLCRSPIKATVRTYLS